MALTRRLAVSLLASLAVGVATTAGASAAAKLSLKVNGGAAAPGSSAMDELVVSVPVSNEGRGVGGTVEKCLLESWHGKLVTNGKQRDLLAFPATTFLFCKNETGPGFSISGGTETTVKVASSGAVRVKFAPKLAIHEPGPCTYEYAKVAVTYTYPGI